MKQRKNSKGEIENFLDEVSFEEEVLLGFDETLDKDGNVVKK